MIIVEYSGKWRELPKLKKNIIENEENVKKIKKWRYWKWHVKQNIE